MDKTWIKLYRRAKDHDIMTDPTAWTLFCWLLMSVNRDTGSMKVGRYMLAEALKMKPGTIYDALSRLEDKYKLVKLTTDKATIKFTVVTIQKWHFYQGGNISDNNQPTINQQSTNTYTRIENRELRKGSGKNPILEDPLFKRYLEVKNLGDDSAVRFKMSALPALDRRYPKWKFQSEWNEATAVMKQTN